ncbi:transcription termination factor 2-like [Strongylocentrotus purpuratus]|uniref:Uncharacterized protein n=1 Tax=Strongylocentrotus purpuratus TaxID=7668 RepID=A0A7M7P9N6_STRPU|nr:transcription termination factor 2-like [Strongylocentrotus purpuratus]
MFEDQPERALETCPSAETEADDPSHLQVTLKSHQKHALAWLSWREAQKNPCGGILVDKTRLGYIQTMISLVLLKKQEAHKESENPCTLVICPASNMDQWAKEVERFCEPGQLKVYLYRGTNREISPEKLAKYDMVFASYNQVRSDLKPLLKDDKGVKALKDDEASTGSKNQPAFLRESWDRIILDEAHNIKNHIRQTAITICQLKATARWAVTGYPIQNNTMELFSLIRFLRCTPFDEYQVWKRQVENAGSTKLATLRILVKSLVLQRTKSSSGNPIASLPKKKKKKKKKMKKEIHSICLSSEERNIYDQLVKQYRRTPYNLVNQLRLGQCCGHLSLLKELPDQESCETDGIKLGPGSGQVKPKTNLYQHSFLSAKIKFLIYGLKKIRAAGPADRPIKTVLVSKSTKMLDVVASHLKKAKFKYWSIRGDIPPKKRFKAMRKFNNPGGREIMLLSMKARGRGLKLIRDNHIVFLDMHWNPVVEDQACDWIYRPGQTRSVHKFVCSNTIEEKVLQRQTEKRQLANDVLRGSKSKKMKLR